MLKWANEENLPKWTKCAQDIPALDGATFRPLLDSSWSLRWKQTTTRRQAAQIQWKVAKPSGLDGSIATSEGHQWRSQTSVGRILTSGANFGPFWGQIWPFWSLNLVFLLVWITCEEHGLTGTDGQSTEALSGLALGVEQSTCLDRVFRGPLIKEFGYC